MLVLKISRAFFALISTVANATLVYLVPFIPLLPLQLFTVAVVNGVIVYLSTDVADNAQGTAPISQ